MSIRNGSRCTNRAQGLAMDQVTRSIYILTATCCFELREAGRQGRSLPMGQPGQSERLAPPPPVHKNL
jgi:hypothetical protein